jgi:dihydroneopterin aldolase
MQAQIELRDLQIAARIGTCGPHDTVPDAHLLDLTLTIAPALVLIAADDMDLVFDYDPLIARIDAIARDGLYATQERLMTRILAACAEFAQIEAAEICLRKRPVLDRTGSLGVRLAIDAARLRALRT